MFRAFCSFAWDSGGSEKVHRAGNQEVWVLASVPLLTFR